MSLRSTQTIVSLAHPFVSTSATDLVAREVWSVLCDPVFCKSSPADLAGTPGQEYLRQIHYWIERDEPVRLSMIAFPFKVSGNPLKTNRTAPDFGELAFLQRLVDLSQAIRLKYALGAHWTILTEGEFYKNLFGVSDEDVVLYQAGLRDFVKLLKAEDIISFVSLAELAAQFSDFEARVAARARALEGAVRTEGVGERRPFFSMCFTSLPVREYDEQALAAVYGLADRPLTLTELALKHELETRALQLMFRYIASNEVRASIGDRGMVRDSFPHHLYVSITQKPGRYAFYPLHQKTKFFPHHGVPVVERDGRTSVHWLYNVRRYPEVFGPVFTEGDLEQLPFYYERITR